MSTVNFEWYIEKKWNTHGQSWGEREEWRLFHNFDIVLVNACTHCKAFKC